MFLVIHLQNAHALWFCGCYVLTLKWIICKPAHWQTLQWFQVKDAGRVGPWSNLLCKQIQGLSCDDLSRRWCRHRLVVVLNLHRTGDLWLCDASPVSASLRFSVILGVLNWVKDKLCLRRPGSFSICTFWSLWQMQICFFLTKPLNKTALDINVSNRKQINSAELNK